MGLTLVYHLGYPIPFSPKPGCENSDKPWMENSIFQVDPCSLISLPNNIGQLIIGLEKEQMGVSESGCRDDWLEKKHSGTILCLPCPWWVVLPKTRYLHHVFKSLVVHTNDLSKYTSSDSLESLIPQLSVHWSTLGFILIREKREKLILALT